jgi:NitT/TauT family transport system ATP-binding protein
MRPDTDEASAKNSGTTLLQAKNLSVRYPGRGPDEQDVLALEDIDLEVHEGEFVSVVGPSGCGKSTLLSTLGGLLPGFEGQIRVKDHEIDGPHPEVGVVFQEDSTFPWRSTLGNVEFGLEMRGVSKEERRRKAEEVLKMVGLESFKNRYPGQLSGGMKQRVAIARTLVMEPAILLMDEPFGALDEQTRIILGEELLRIQEALGQTIVFITHNIQEAILLSDRVVVLSARPGKIKAVVPVDLPRPRDSTLLASDHFTELVGEVWSVLREESLKGFEQVEAAEEGESDA